MKSGMRPLGQALGALLRPALRRRGFAVSEILTRWPLIVGESLAEMVAPERLRFPAGGYAAPKNRAGAPRVVGAPGARGGVKRGTQGEAAVLHVRVAPGFGPEVQHQEPLIVDRINSYYGFRAVGRLKLVQGPLPALPRKPERSPRPLLPAEEERIERLVGGVGDPGLRESLARLGRNLAGRAKSEADAPAKG